MRNVPKYSQRKYIMKFLDNFKMSGKQISEICLPDILFKGKAELNGLFSGAWPALTKSYIF